MIKVFALPSTKVGPDIINALASLIPGSAGRISTTVFSDGETEVRFPESVRGESVFLIQSTHSPQAIMELLLACNAAHYASAKSITAVIPYFGYARQDRKSVARVSMGARLLADVLQAAGCTRVITMDLHAAQEQAFFSIPVDHVHATTLFIPYIQKLMDANLDKEYCIVAPDAGAAKNAELYSKALNLPLVLCHKHRSGPNQVDKIQVIGDVNHLHCILIDDIIDTAGTITKCANVLRFSGAESVTAMCTHPLLSGDAINTIDESHIDNLVCTDTTGPFQSPEFKNTNFIKLSISMLFAQVIVAAFQDKSIESLYAIDSH